MLLLLFIGVASATCGCCSTWLRDAQTAKNMEFLYSSGEAFSQNVVPIVAVGSATVVKEIQIDVKFGLQNDLSSVCQSECTPPPVCAYCRYIITGALVINHGQGASVEPFTTLDGGNQIKGVSLPRNDSDVLYGGIGMVNCYGDVYEFEWNSASDCFFDTKFAGGIQLNDGESIDFYWAWSPSYAQCQSLETPDLIVAGLSNYYLSYAECPVGDYAACVKETDE